MNLPVVLRLVALLSFLTSAVIGFIDGFKTNPLLDWPWALPICVALIAAAFALIEISHLVKNPTPV